MEKFTVKEKFNYGEIYIKINKNSYFKLNLRRIGYMIFDKMINRFNL